MFYSQGNLQDNFCCKNGSRINQNHSIVNINKAIFSLNFGSCDLQRIANSGLFCDYAISSTSDSTKIFAKIFAFYFITNLRLDNDYSTPKMAKSLVKCLYFFYKFQEVIEIHTKEIGTTVLPNNCIYDFSNKLDDLSSICLRESCFP